MYKVIEPDDEQRLKITLPGFVLEAYEDLITSSGPLLASVAGALGAEYCSPYLAVDTRTDLCYRSFKELALVAVDFSSALKMKND
ncbi:hypothetical protein RYX36_023577 [Vicia faba]